MKRHVFAFIFAPLLAAGCVAIVPVPGEPTDACLAGELQYLVGQPGVVLNGMRFSQDVRVIEYGMAVTMDYREDRVNLDVDADNRVTGVRCT